MRASDVTVFRHNFSIVIDWLSPSDQRRCPSGGTGTAVDLLAGIEVLDVMASVSNN